MSHDQLTALAIGSGVIAALWLVNVLLNARIDRRVNRAMRAYIIAGTIQPRDKRGRFRAR